VLVTDKAMWPDLEPALRDLPGLRQVVLAGAGRCRARPPVAARCTISMLRWRRSRMRGAAPHEGGGPRLPRLHSGTTGHPKGVLHAHRAMIGRKPAASHWFDFHPGDRIMHSGKFNWTYVLGSGLMDPLYNGLTVIVHEGANDATLWPRLIAKHGCTVFIGVPTIYARSSRRRASRSTTADAAHCMSAGEHLSDEMLSAWRERFRHGCLRGDRHVGDLLLPQPEQIPTDPSGSAGFPQPGHDVRLLDEDLQRSQDGEEGMICIRGDDPACSCTTGTSRGDGEARRGAGS